MRGNSLLDAEPVSFSMRTLLHGVSKYWLKRKINKFPYYSAQTKTLLLCHREQDTVHPAAKYASFPTGVNCTWSVPLRLLLASQLCGSYRLCNLADKIHYDTVLHVTESGNTAKFLCCCPEACNNSNCFMHVRSTFFKFLRHKNESHIRL